jgi:hypothetical protein
MTFASENPERGVAWRTVTTRDAVRLLLNGDSRRFLEPFMLRTHTVKGLSEVLRVPLNAAHHRVRSLERAGLLRVVHLESRRGRAVKHYAAAAQGFFVPFTATTNEGLEGFVEQQTVPLFTQFMRAFVRSASSLVHNVNEVGFRFYEADGFVNMNFSPRGQAFNLLEGLLAPNAPALMASFSTLHLSNDDAKQLQLEMLELIAKYLERPGPQGYIVNVGMAPCDPTPG